MRATPPARSRSAASRRTCRHAAAVHPASWRGEHVVHGVRGRALLAGRHPHDADADPQRRRPPGDAVADRRQGEPDAAARGDLQSTEQQDDRARRVTACSTTGTESNVYDQTLRVNGVAQRDLRINCPGFPDPFAAAAGAACRAGLGAGVPIVQPGGRIQASPALKMPHVHQASVSIDRPLTANLRAGAGYQMLRGRDQMRARDINTPDPLTGLRPEPAIGSVTQFESTGRSARDTLYMNVGYAIPRRQMNLGMNYTLAQFKNHSDNATQLPVDSYHPDLGMGSVGAGHPAPPSGKPVSAAGFRSARDAQRPRLPVGRAATNITTRRGRQPRPGHQRPAARRRRPGDRTQQRAWLGPLGRHEHAPQSRVRASVIGGEPCRPPCRGAAALAQQGGGGPRGVVAGAAVFSRATAVSISSFTRRPTTSSTA